jgi:methylated-DNA-protein-cysteine methyltransferase-like protein
LAADARFTRRVLAVVKRIPVGRVTTYGDVARQARHPREARQGGIPYHRVIAAGGQLGGYSDLSLKRALLAAEGLVVSARRVRHFEKVRWP